MKNFLFTILLVLSTLCVSNVTPAAKAATQQQMRFHCDKDTTEINDLLQKGEQSGLKKPNELVTFYAHELMGRPYVAHTLEGKTEMLTINIDELDCTTFVETLYALARTTMNGRYSWRDFANNLENLRYRDGKLGDYSSRLHYISEWIVDNSNRGNIEEATINIPGATYITKTINFMTTHRESYPSLTDSTIYEKLVKYESGYINHRFPYVKKEWLGSKDVKNALKSGDFVCLVTKTPGLDVSHLGIIEKDDKGDIYLLDASSIGMKVQIEKEDMMEMLRRNRGNLGVRIVRIKE
jgi:hypothetical protein